MIVRELQRILNAVDPNCIVVLDVGEDLVLCTEVDRKANEQQGESALLVLGGDKQ